MTDSVKYVNMWSQQYTVVYHLKLLKIFEIRLIANILQIDVLHIMCLSVIFICLFVCVCF